LAADRLRIWETLFQRAIELIDSMSGSGITLEDWSFGGGTALMRRHYHRISKDIDIFMSDPQYLGYLTPRLSTKAESLTQNYVEQHGFVKLFFPEGEIDFIVAGPLTPQPTVIEVLFGRNVRVETSTEIVAKKVWHRGQEFTARDIFDLAMVAEREPAALQSIRPVLRSRRGPMLEYISTHEATLRETFAALEILDYRRSFNECVEIVKAALGQE
jgi:hypothetical protein